MTREQTREYRYIEVEVPEGVKWLPLVQVQFRHPGAGPIQLIRADLCVLNGRDILSVSPSVGGTWMATIHRTGAPNDWRVLSDLSITELMVDRKKEVRYPSGLVVVLELVDVKRDEIEVFENIRDTNLIAKKLAMSPLVAYV